MQANRSETRRWRKRPEASNWGDFGPDDQVGRMNLITPARRLAALAEVKDGLAFALSLPLDHPGGGGITPFRKPPSLAASVHADGTRMFNHVLGIGTSDPCGVVCDDRVSLSTQFSTQWDSLAHWGSRFDADDDGEAELVFYNGYRAGEHLVGPKADGATYAKALGIETLAVTGVQGRAVVVSLLDAFGPGRTWVDHGKLMQAMSAQGAEVRAGDFLLLHTGFDDTLLKMGDRIDAEALEETGAVLDGRDPELRAWVRDTDIVAICADNLAVEGFGFPDRPGEYSMLPLHDLCLFKLGVYLGELWRLGDLSRWLLARKRTACLLTAPPLRLPGAVGSPLTPVATV